MQVMSAVSYLDEYRQKYGPIKSAAGVMTTSSHSADVQTLLSRYLGSTSKPSEKIYHYETSQEPVAGDELDSRVSPNVCESDDDLFDEDLDKSLLPTTTGEKHKITVNEIMRQDTQLADIRNSKHLRRHSNPGDSNHNMRRAFRRSSSSSDGLTFTTDCNNNIKARRATVKSDSDGSGYRSRRRDSNISTRSVESNASNRSTVSFKSDILELSDEDFDLDFEIDLNSSKQSDSDSHKLFSQFQLDSDSQRDAESVTGSEEGEGPCRNCRPISARSSCSSDSYVSLCAKCVSHRTERQATIAEILDSEKRYSTDLLLIKEHFHDTLLENTLLSSDDVTTIFGPAITLLGVSNKFLEQLSSHLQKLTDGGDDFYADASIGQLICDSSAMFLAFETYCLNYSTAIALIDQLRKENELFNLFLEASQNDNSDMRRMDIKTFLMLPVQRIMKYPLLLKRLHKVTSATHADRDAIESANEKLTNILHHINAKSKLLSSILYNSKDSSKSKKQTSFEIALTKLVLDTLNWRHDEIHFLCSGKIGYLQAGESQLTEKLKHLRFNTAYAVLVTQGRDGNIPKSSKGNKLLFPQKTCVKSAALLIIKKGSSRLQVLGEPHFLSGCLVSRNSEFYDVFEIQKYFTDSLTIRPVNSSESWYRNLKYFSMVLGGRNYTRRKALPNILLNM